MEFTINRAMFAEALSFMQSIISERATRHILQNFKLEGTTDNTIILSATDLETNLIITLPVTTMQEPSNVCLPIGNINGLVSKLRVDEVRVEVTDLKAVIYEPHGKSTIAGTDSEEFPEIKVFNDEKSVLIHGEDIIDAVQKTAFAASKGDTKYSLNGIFVHINGSKAEFVASDTHRLSLVTKKIRNADNIDAEGIFQLKGMTLLSKLAQNSDILHLVITKEELQVKTDNAIISIRRVEGMFPNYQAVVPAKTDQFISISCSEFEDVLIKAGVFLEKNSEKVEFIIEPEDNSMTVLASNDKGDRNGRWKIDADIQGPKIEIKFNPLFLLDVLKHIKDEKINIQYKDSNIAARIDNDDMLYIVMPMNL